jgi:galactokinase/mevalonate kinase-like predicted kinase
MMTPQRRQEWQSHRLMLFTGLSRTSDTIAARQIENLGSRR